jgi:hypothetical protein
LYEHEVNICGININPLGELIFPIDALWVIVVWHGITNNSMLLTGWNVLLYDMPKRLPGINCTMDLLFIFIVCMARILLAVIEEEVVGIRGW